MIKICSYCGYFQENDEDKRCDCGGYFVSSSDNREYYSWERDRVMAHRQGDLCDGDNNNIDNILEWKRSRSKVYSK